MHLPQVRSLRNRPEVRRSLRPPSQHHQREDLRLPLVLVRLPGRRDEAAPDVPPSGRHGALPQENSAQGHQLFPAFDLGRRGNFLQIQIIFFIHFKNSFNVMFSLISLIFT